MPESFFVLSKDNLELAIDEVIAIAKMYDRFSKVKVISNLVMIQSKTNWRNIKSSIVCENIRTNIKKNVRIVFR